MNETRKVQNQGNRVGDGSLCQVAGHVDLLTARGAERLLHLVEDSGRDGALRAPLSKKEEINHFFTKHMTARKQTMSSLDELRERRPKSPSFEDLRGKGEASARV